MATVYRLSTRWIASNLPYAGARSEIDRFKVPTARAETVGIGGTGDNVNAQLRSEEV